MAYEYVIAGRRALPGGFLRLRTWRWTFEIEDTRSEDDEGYDHDAQIFDDGSFELDEIRRRGNGETYAFVEEHAGFAPKSVVMKRAPAVVGGPPLTPPRPTLAPARVLACAPP